MSPIDAVYADGVFRPHGPVPLAESQTVRLAVTTVPRMDPEKVLAWLARTQAHRAALAAAGSSTTDSTQVIAEDRRRDG